MHPTTGNAWPNEYGCHHAKFLLVGFPGGGLRVVVNTANNIYIDWHNKSNGAYVDDFPLKTGDASQACDYEDSLVDYLETLLAFGGSSQKQCLSRLTFGGTNLLFWLCVWGGRNDRSPSFSRFGGETPSRTRYGTRIQKE